MLISLDDALAAGRFQVSAETRRLAGGRERSDHGTVVDAFGSEIGLADDQLTIAEQAWKLPLQAMESRLRLSFSPVRGQLDGVGADRHGTGRGDVFRCSGMCRSGVTTRAEGQRRVVRVDRLGPDLSRLCRPRGRPWSRSR